MDGSTTELAADGAATRALEYVVRLPAPHLQAHVRVYQGYRHVSRAPVREVHLPAGAVPLIIGFGDPLVSVDPSDPEGVGRSYSTFVAGVFESPSITDSAGLSYGLQVDFTPLGAYQFVGQPMHRLTNRVIELDEILGAAARQHVERLLDAPSWDARFELLDRIIGERLAEARAPSEGVAWACAQLTRTCGRASISALTSQLGWSRKHIVSQFREQVGVTPKTLARILRFDYAVHLLDREGTSRPSAIALDAGYYDQAHFIRDFRQFAGGTPGEFVARRRRERLAGSSSR